MSVTRCPRCGSKITPKHRFCQECGLPVWEADQVSEKLTNHPVPFSLSDEHRRFYAASNTNDAARDSAKRTADSTTGKTYLVTVENGTGGDYYRPGEKVLITAVVPEGSELGFTGWEITEGDVLISNRMSETAYFIMPKENVFVTARLSDIKYTVTVTNGEGGGKYSAGDKVTLTAYKSDRDHVFEGWEIKSGDMVLSNPASETVFFYMPRGNVEVLAVFREKRTLILTVKNGKAGAKELHAGETTVITADKADDGYFFTGWTIEGDASAEDLLKEQTTLTIGKGDVTVAARYDVIPILKSGAELHEAFLQLAESGANHGKLALDKKIKCFRRSDEAPSEGTKTKDISETGPTVQVWFDDTDGSICWYSDAKSVRLNGNSAGLFSGFTVLSEIDFTAIDTGCVTDMGDMFYNCRSLKSLDLSSFDTRNVTNMSGMFEFCNSLTSLDLSSFNTENVTGMRMMFWLCSSLTSLDLSNFDTRNVTNMSTMFWNCSSLTDLKAADEKILYEYSRR